MSYHEAQCRFIKPTMSSLTFLDHRGMLRSALVKSKWECKKPPVALSPQRAFRKPDVGLN